MKRRIILAVGGLFAGLYAVTAQALTYLPMTDEALLAQSPVVVLGQVQAVADSDVLNRPETEYQLAVMQVLKGEVPSNSIAVEVPGSRAATGQLRRYPGAPVFAQGETVLLFLNPHDDGRYGVMQMALGAFALRQDVQGRPVFVRNLGDALRLDVTAPRANAQSEMPRDAEQFIQALGGLPVHGELLDSNNRHTANYTLMERSDNLGRELPPARWFEFDAGQNVPFYAHSGGQPQMSGGGFAEFQEAIRVWNADAGSNVRYQYAGKTNATGGFRDNDGINSILFDDPDSDVDGSFDCQTGGVLAAGGFVSSSSTSNYNGQPFSSIQEADIITNNGAGCFFASGQGKNGEEVFAHELGHTLGLGHSCGDGDTVVDVLGNVIGSDDCSGAADAALMRAFPQADGRGAFLGSDDRAGIAFLYETSGSGGSDVNGDSGSTKPKRKKSSGGGGGCALQTGGPVDPTLWLLSLIAMGYVLRKSQRA